VAEVKETAAGLLSSLADRWQHTRSVAARAEELAAAVPVCDRGLLVVAAWWHDLGYSPALRVTGLHQLDGARYLMRLRLGPPRWWSGWQVTLRLGEARLAGLR
jgi:HD superfamily phosphodiesterase